jgi:hypothetical protein
MNHTNHYYPEGLGWTMQGDKCRVRDIERMTQNILTTGTVTHVHRHTAQSYYPNGTTELWHTGTKALTVESDNVPGLTYVIHLHGFRVVEIIEIMTFDGPNEQAGE